MSRFPLAAARDYFRPTPKYSPRVSATCRNSLMILAAWVLGFGAPIPQLSGQEKVDWEGDLAFLAKELPARHIRPFAVQSEAEFQRQVAAVREGLATRSDLVNTVEFMRLVAGLRDGHTAVLRPQEEGHYLPLQMHWFPEGLFVVAAGTGAEAAFEARITHLGNMPIEEILKNLETLVPHDNPSHFRHLAALHLSQAELLVGMGAAPALTPIEVGFERSGQTSRLSLQPLAWNQIRNLKWTRPQFSQPPLYLQKSQLPHWNDWIANEHTIYFKYNRCQDRAAFQKLVQGTAGFIAQNDVRRFVLDLRDNGGGDSSIFDSLYQYLSSHPTLNRKGALYVIIGRKTFSSAVLNAMAMRQTQAILIGEPSGGRPNHFGEVKTFTLPSSRLTVSYSTKHFRPMAEADPDAIEPDIRVEIRFADWQAGRDPVLEKILEEK